MEGLGEEGPKGGTEVVKKTMDEELVGRVENAIFFRVPEIYELLLPLIYGQSTSKVVS